VGTVTVEEDLQGDPEEALMGLIEKGTSAVAASLSITEHRFHTGIALIDPRSQGVSVTQEQQRQRREHGMHERMPRRVHRIRLRR
jgi:hypothetical protein